jgi:hypothetical protein
MDTSLVSGITGGVVGAIRKAAEATGSGFSYLLHTGITESQLDPTAKAPTSSASGLFQFTKETWLETVKEEGPSLGMAGLAAKISKGSDGRYTVANPADRQAILALRNDPSASALMAGALAQKNGAALATALGRPPSDGELYIAHFLGAQGATALLGMARRNPGTSAATAFPAAAAANPSVFYSNGQPRTVAVVRAALVAREGSAATVAAAGVPALAFGDTDDDAPVVEQGPIFNSIFHSGRRAPIAAYVDAVWSGLSPANAMAAGAASAAAPATTAAPRSAAGPARRGGAVAAPLDLLHFLRPGGRGAA